MRQIETGVYRFSRASIYQYLLVEGSTSFLIDTGLALFARDLIRELAKILPESHINTLLITHADGDHYGAAGKIRQKFHNRTAASEAEAEAIRSGRMSRQVAPQSNLHRLMIKTFLPVFHTPPAEVDEILKPGQILPIFDGLHVIDSAGHTPGHLSFYLPEKGILFAGDSIVERNHVPSPAYGYNCWNEDRARETFERQMALKPAHMCSGHSYFKMK